MSNIGYAHGQIVFSHGYALAVNLWWLSTGKKSVVMSLHLGYTGLPNVKYNTDTVDCRLLEVVGSLYSTTTSYSTTAAAMLACCTHNYLLKHCNIKKNNNIMMHMKRTI